MSSRHIMAINSNGSDPVDTHSDAELFKYIHRLRAQRPYQTLASSLVGISPAYVAKRYSCGEGLRDVILAIDLAHSMNIRAPHVRRVVYQDDAYECIFDRVHGPNLMECWARLSWFTTLRLAF